MMIINYIRNQIGDGDMKTGWIDEHIRVDGHDPIKLKKTEEKWIKLSTKPVDDSMGGQNNYLTSHHKDQ